VPQFPVAVSWKRFSAFVRIPLYPRPTLRHSRNYIMYKIYILCCTHTGSQQMCKMQNILKNASILRKIHQTCFFPNFANFVEKTNFFVFFKTSFTKRNAKVCNVCPRTFYSTCCFVRNTISEKNYSVIHKSIQPCCVRVESLFARRGLCKKYSPTLLLLTGH
jgi:hypothetical protein